MKRDCDTCRYFEVDFDYLPCSACRGCDKWEAQTNADHIRYMTDEELALLFGAMCKTSECYAVDGSVCPFADNCPIDALGDNLWLNWLKQPYKEDT